MMFIIAGQHQPAIFRFRGRSSRRIIACQFLPGGHQPANSGSAADVFLHREQEVDSGGLKFLRKSRHAVLHAVEDGDLELEGPRHVGGKGRHSHADAEIVFPDSYDSFDAVDGTSRNPRRPIHAVDGEVCVRKYSMGSRAVAKLTRVLVLGDVQFLKPGRSRSCRREISGG